MKMYLKIKKDRINMLISLSHIWHITLRLELNVLSLSILSRSVLLKPEYEISNHYNLDRLKNIYETI